MSFITWTELRVKLMLLHMERMELMWLRNLIRAPSGHVLLGRDPRADPALTQGTNYPFCPGDTTSDDWGEDSVGFPPGTTGKWGKMAGLLD